ncbi:MAG TPA: glycoside hydrolase family 27 protein [Longimicrobiaceae bacterium]|nr:glycoside hydrolase family 27 protein [Longimicrobiaceae bacterium]
MRLRRKGARAAAACTVLWLSAACAHRVPSAAPAAAGSEAGAPAYWAFAPTPPMGWNSWDAFATTVTEAQIRAQTDYMADRLARYGWQYVVVDIQWYEPNSTGFQYRPGAVLTMDGYGRLLPAPNRFPSAAGGTGFRSLAGYVHGKGLKFGVHLLRGIPRQAVARNTPILGTPYHAADVADTTSTCAWNTDMYGVDMSKPGAQAYYDSVFRLLAEWGVDFVKVDDLSRPYHREELEAIRKAIDHAGRPMVLSTSPGETPLAAGEHVSHNANMWRVSDDFWDTWPSLVEQFARLDKWTPFRGPGHWPDADMLPLGAIRQVPGYRGGPWTRFTPDEQRTMMTLWAIARSPLIMGGDLTKNDDYTLSLLTNEEVIAVDQASTGNHQLFDRDGQVAWVAEVPGSSDLYLAVFNARDPSTGENAGIPVAVPELGFEGAYRVRDLWQKKDLGRFTGDFAPVIPWHGAGLYRISGERHSGSSPNHR